MKVLLNATVVDAQPSGLGRYAMELAQHLRERVDLVVATPVPESFPGLRCVKTPLWVMSSSSRLRGYPRYLWVQTGLREVLKDQRPHVLLSPNHELMMAPPVPQVAVIHDLIAYFYPRGRRGKSLYFRYALPRLLRDHTAAIITVSASTKDDLVREFRVFPDKIRVARSGLGARAGFREPQFPVPERYILYAGRFMPYKNIENLLLAFADLAPKVSCHLILAGPTGDRGGAFVRGLRNKAHSLGIASRVHFPGYIPSQSLGWLYKNASVFVLPSLYEGFGFPPLEAMACGTPVAVSRIPALVETVGDAGVYFDPRSPEDMAGAITRVLEDARLREVLVKRGHERVKRFSWERTAASVYEVLKEVARG